MHEFQSAGKQQSPQPTADIKEAPPDAVLKPVLEYDPISMACWRRGAATPYLHIARALSAVDSTTKRLKIGDALTNLFRSVIELSPGQQAQDPCPLSIAMEV